MEKVVVITTWLKNSDKKLVFESLDELNGLVRTANGETVKEFIVKRDKIDPAYYIGKGKVEEIANYTFIHNIHTVIFDNELTPAQIRNLEEKLDTKIVDRTRLILDIFAQRAHTKEAQLQVELAQLKYLLPRLTKKGIYLDNQVGGIGTRGPGETKLEYDRRKIMQRILKINQELKKIELHRNIQKQQRIQTKIPLIALVGYTNTGKSTLFNTLLKETEAYADDKLFATLDPLIRKIKLPSKIEVLIIDTVGFINKLPHHLVESFKSTLEVIKDAHLLLEVIDITRQNFVSQTNLVTQVLTSLGADKIPVIKVYNKIDLLPEKIKRMYTKKFRIVNNTVFISAKTGEGVDKLVKIIDKKINTNFIIKNIKLRSDQYNLISELYKYGTVISNSVNEENIMVKIKTTKELYNKLKHLI